MKEKPPVLSDKQIYDVSARAMNACNDIEEIKQWRSRQALCQAQRDAGAAYYEPLMEQERQLAKIAEFHRMTMYYSELMAEQIEGWRNRVQQAKELEEVFELRHKADRRAIIMWRGKHPERGLTLPDHADMVVWLLERLDKFEDILKQEIAQNLPNALEVEQAKAEVAREIFEGIRKLLIPTNVPIGSPVPRFYIRETKLKDFESKYMEEK